MLNHVCYWNKEKNGWTPITLTEAERLFPEDDITIQSKQGLFMCDLCGKYVTLTKKTNKTHRFFKHNKWDDDKNCPERLVNQGIYGSQYKESPELPLKLTYLPESHQYKLEVGIPPIPQNYLEKYEKAKFTICIDGFDTDIYLIDRLQTNRITYFPVKTHIGKKLKLKFLDTELPKEYKIPSEVRVQQDCLVFNAKTGLKIPLLGDVTTGNEYYILTQIQLKNLPEEIYCERLCFKYSWYLYVVKTDFFTEDVARFFLDFGVRLMQKDSAVSLTPLWPVGIRSAYTYCPENNGNIYFLVSGQEVEAKVRKVESINPVSYSQYFAQQILPENESLFAVGVADTMQMLVLSRSYHTLRYIYLKPLKEKKAYIQLPRSYVLVDGEPLSSGIYPVLPQNGIKVELDRDGFIEILKKNMVIWRQDVKAGTPMNIPKEYWKYTIQVYCGLDCLWSGSFGYKLEAPKQIQNQSLNLYQLQRARGGWQELSVPKGLMLIKQCKDPKIKRWIKLQMQQGKIQRNVWLLMKRSLR